MLSEADAIKEAEHTLRFDIGSMPHLGPTRYSDEDNCYVFQIRISYPRVPRIDDTVDEPSFDQPEAIGELIVDDETGDTTHTPNDVLNSRIGAIKNRDPDERRQRD